MFSRPTSCYWECGRCKKYHKHDNRFIKSIENVNAVKMLIGVISNFWKNLSQITLDLKYKVPSIQAALQGM